MYNETLSFLQMMKKSLEKGPFGFSISLPHDAPPVARLEKDPARLRKTAEDGRRAASEAVSLVWRPT